MADFVQLAKEKFVSNLYRAGLVLNAGQHGEVLHFLDEYIVDATIPNLPVEVPIPEAAPEPVTQSVDDLDVKEN
jgi:hypothetical protein